MRRLTALFAAAVLLLTGCGGKQKPQEDEQPKNTSSAATMTMVQTQFPQEVEDILKLLDVKGDFYDFAVDDTVSGFTMNVWVLTDGKWVSSGEINGKIENKQGKIGIQLLEDGCNFFQLNDSGNTKYSVKYNAHLNECTSIATMGLDSEEITILESGKEQFLFIEMGWKDDKTEMNVITEDFRNSDCDAGVAATITFTAAPGTGAP